MAAPRLTAVFRTGPAPPAADPRPDADLLARFLAHADEAAFAALVARHTPAVRAVCRGWLRSAADVDDAAQATFLVLVRRADVIRDRQALAAWLYRVAGHTARRLRAQLSKAGPLPADVPAREPAAPDDRVDLLAAEVARLPEKYRLPVQLCYAAGLTTQATVSGFPRAPCSPGWPAPAGCCSGGWPPAGWRPSRSGPWGRVAVRCRRSG